MKYLKNFEHIDFRKLDRNKIYHYSTPLIAALYEAIGKIKVTTFDKIIMYEFIDNSNRKLNLNLGMVVDLDLVREATPEEIEHYQLCLSTIKYNL